MMIRKIITIVVFTAFSLIASNSLLAREMVLVTMSNDVILQLTVNELRRAYLGLPIEKQNIQIIPIRNYTDLHLHEIF